MPRNLLVLMVAVCVSFPILFGCNTKESRTDVPVVSPPTDLRFGGVADNPGDKDVRDVHSPTREAQIESVNDLISEGKSDQASELLRQMLVENPKDSEVLFYLANVLAGKGDLQDAVDLLSEIAADEPEAGIAALGVAAEWCFELEQYDEVERRYLEILKRVPDANMARRPLAYLYNRQGRRHEAVKLIRELCRSGDVTQDELHALVIEADAMHDPISAQPASGERPYWPIGPMGQARLEFTEHRYTEAASLVEPIVKSGEAHPSVVAFYGCAVAEAQDDDKFDWWLTAIDDRVLAYPEYWAAIGTRLMATARYEEGLRALAEAIAGDPTDIRSTRRVVQAFRAMNNQPLVDKWVERYQSLIDTVATSSEVADGRTEKIVGLAEHLKTQSRNLEALLWLGIFSVRQKMDDDVMRQLNTERLAILHSNQAFPTATSILSGLNVGKQSLPSLVPDGSPTKSSRLTNRSYPDRDQIAKPRFRDISHEVGLKHTYEVATTMQERGFAIYQQNGGGIAVLDFDLDGNADLYLAQGAADPPDFKSKASDQLFRTLVSNEKAVVADVTDVAGLTEDHYTIGVTAGDWNQDGFPDLAVSNIGSTVLLISHGDGTFQPLVLEIDESMAKLKTSLAMGDVNGDSLPDLFVLNYLRDSRLTVKPDLNSDGFATKPMTPHDFVPALDQVWINHGDGQASVEEVGSRSSDESYGLGVVLTNFGRGIGNDVFVGNDSKANQLWSYDYEARKWTDSAVARGCAFGSQGAPTASMGIGSGDFDNSGGVDLHVANFYNESSSLYMNQDGMFRDLNVKFGIDRSSKSVLGFGTQAIDFSNDAWLDLVVANGHIEDLAWAGIPFRQQPQLLTNLGNEFVAAQVDDPSSYWSNQHLSRSVATLDFNRDGMQDLVINGLMEPTVLLLNETRSENHWLGIKLVGTKSERDAIGAKIELQAEGSNHSFWMTSGDGYLCKNEARVCCGLGAVSMIDHVTVLWPSGLRQVFRSIPIDAHLLLVEADPEPVMERR